MKKTKLCFLALALTMLLLSACSGKIAEIKYTPLPQIHHDDGGPASNEITISGKKFRQVIDLELYNNPYFETALNEGKLNVKIVFLELWDDFADIKSEDESDKKEGERRQALSEILKKTRSFSAASGILAVWELPCSTRKDAGDAKALIKTEDMSYFIVDLVSEDKMGEIEASELSSLNGLDGLKLFWATTGIYTAEEKAAGEDFLIVKNAKGEIVAKVPLN